MDRVVDETGTREQRKAHAADDLLGDLRAQDQAPRRPVQGHKPGESARLTTLTRIVFG